MASNGNATQNQCVNLTVDDAFIWLYSPLETTIIIGILPWVGALGLIANAVFQIAVIRNPNLQTKTNYYLFTLAVYDEIILVTTIFIWYVGSYIANPVSYALPFFHNCWFIVGAIVTCMLGSTGLVTLVTFDRYVALCHPVTYRNKFTVKTTRKIIIVNAIASAVISTGFQRWGKNVTVCIIWPEEERFAGLPTSINTYDTAYDFPFADLLFFDIPIYVALVMNIYMYVKIVRKISTLESSSSEPNNRCMQVARVLIVNGLVYAVCQLPYRLISASDIAKYATGNGFFTEGRYEEVLIIGRMFLEINSFINPFIYGLASNFYRQEIKKVFCQRCTDKESNTDPAKSTVFSISMFKPNPSGRLKYPESTNATFLEEPKTDPGGSLGVDNVAYGSVYTGPGMTEDEKKCAELNQVAVKI